MFNLDPISDVNLDDYPIWVIDLALNGTPIAKGQLGNLIQFKGKELWIGELLMHEIRRMFDFSYDKGETREFPVGSGNLVNPVIYGC